MYLTLMKGKIHRATVTGCELGYEGSITIDPDLLEAANILPYEQVDVLNIMNGARFTTYTIVSKKRSGGEITVNGAAARLVQKGDLVIICSFAQMDEKEARRHTPRVVMVNPNNGLRRRRRSRPVINLTKVQQNALARMKTFSARIRYLDSQGLARAEISTLLGKRYQHVRNVLENPPKQRRPGRPRKSTRKKPRAT